MGGLATERDALIALECNVDFVQGSYFAEPSAEPAEPQAAAGLIDALSAALRKRVAAREQAQTERLEPYVRSLAQACERFLAGEPALAAFDALLALPDTARCFVLDAQGRQIGDNVVPSGRVSRRAKRFRPLLHSEGANWAHRPYFTEAVRAPGPVHLTAPYLSLNEAHLCVTASVAAQTARGLQVLCVDIDWEAASSRR
jgi:hypothetical protein